jgi:hypothetical protein
MLAHHLINQLTVIAGSCDLLLADQLPEAAECLRRLRQMREIATSAAEELSRHECELEAIMGSAAREAGKQPPLSRESATQMRAE